jgi:hypothetical protein
MSLILDGTKGETFPSWTTGTRPATPNTGQTGYNTTLGGLETYNGSAWVTPSFGPAFSAYASTNQSVTTSVTTKVTFDTERFDTNNNFASSTFTPTIAGYYNITGIVYSQGTISTVYCFAYKNGSPYQLGSFFASYAGNNGATIVNTTMYLNGTSDYAEIYVNIVGTTPSVVTLGGGIQSEFSGFLARSA